MKRCSHPLFLLLALLCFDQLSAAEPSLPSKENLHLYLLIGQSNMAGRGVLEKKDLPVHPRVIMLNAQNQWAAATEPLHFDKTIAGAGLGASFAQEMAEAYPEATIGLIPCAVGGTPLSRWQKGGDLYQQALARLRVALQAGTLRGILWHQGESDSNDQKLADSYTERWSGMIRDLRADVECPDVPVVAGQLGLFLAEEKQGQPVHWKRINEQIARLPESVAHVAVVDSVGLKDKGDAIHFDTPSLRTFGKRYARTMLRLQGHSKAVTP